jgi:hypothetical protein
VRDFIEGFHRQSAAATDKTTKLQKQCELGLALAASWGAGVQFLARTASRRPMHVVAAELVVKVLRHKLLE